MGLDYWRQDYKWLYIYTYLLSVCVTGVNDGCGLSCVTGDDGCGLSCVGDDGCGLSCVTGDDGCGLSCVGDDGCGLSFWFLM